MNNEINNGINELSLEEMEEVAGGKKKDAAHDLKNFVTARVSVPKGTYLVMQKSIKYKDGDSISVNQNFLEKGYLLAYSPAKDKYGYVDAKYVRF